MLMKEKTPFDFERFEQEATGGLYAGKKAGGTDGVFAPLIDAYRFQKNTKGIYLNSLWFLICRLASLSLFIEYQCTNLTFLLLNSFAVRLN